MESVARSGVGVCAGDFDGIFENLAPCVRRVLGRGMGSERPAGAGGGEGMAPNLG